MAASSFSVMVLCVCVCVCPHWEEKGQRPKRVTVRLIFNLARDGPDSRWLDQFFRFVVGEIKCMKHDGGELIRFSTEAFDSLGHCSSLA